MTEAHDVVIVEGLQVDGPVGVYPHERGILQTLFVDIRVALRTRWTTDDQLDQTIDYDRLAKIAQSVIASKHHELIETIAVKIASGVRDAFGALIADVQVGVAKPGAVKAAKTVRVEVKR